MVFAGRHGQFVADRARQVASTRTEEMRFWLQKTELRSQASEQKRLEAQYRAEINMRHSQWRPAPQPGTTHHI